MNETSGWPTYHNKLIYLRYENVRNNLKLQDYSYMFTVKSYGTKVNITNKEQIIGN